MPLIRKELVLYSILTCFQKNRPTSSCQYVKQSIHTYIHTYKPSDFNKTPKQSSSIIPATPATPATPPHTPRHCQAISLTPDWSNRVTLATLNTLEIATDLHASPRYLNRNQLTPIIPSATSTGFPRAENIPYSQHPSWAPPGHGLL